MLEQEITRRTGIFQTGTDLLDIDGEIHRVKLRPEFMHELILHMARSRQQPGLAEKVSNYFAKQPLEINLSPMEVLGSDEIGDVLGEFTVPECNPNTAWPVIIVPQSALKSLYWADLAIRRMDLFPKIEDLQQALNVNRLYFFPHELEHFINYVDHPEWLRFICQEVPERKTFGSVFFAAATGLLYGLVVEKKFSNEVFTRREFLKRLTTSIAVGIAG